MINSREELIKSLMDYGDRREAFIPGVTYIPVDDSVTNGDESVNLIRSILEADVDFLRPFTIKLFDYLGEGYVNVVSSSMSAHVLLMSVLSGNEFGSRGIRAGDEIITTANNVGIINSALRCGVIPIIVDIDLNTLLPDPTAIEVAVVEGKTKAIILSSPNGNISNGEIMRDIADDYGILFIEDVGYGFGGVCYGVPAGHYADVSIYSFHSSLLGDAGVIVSKSELIHRKLQEACELHSNSHLSLGLGSNKMMYAYLDAQMDKRDYYTDMRRMNWKRLEHNLSNHDKFIRFQKPIKNVSPSWTSFLITLKEPYTFTKTQLMEFLETKKIGTRSLVGNLLQFDGYKSIQPPENELINSDYVNRNSFIIGCHPNMTSATCDYVSDVFDEFMEKYG